MRNRGGKAVAVIELSATRQVARSLHAAHSGVLSNSCYLRVTGIPI
jgi:hypothetical protein